MSRRISNASISTSDTINQEAIVRKMSILQSAAPTTLAEMNAEDTAIWVEMLAKLKGWEEAKTYGDRFKTNDITGQDLQYLSVEALRSELGIANFGHRLEIKQAIENSELTIRNPTIVSLRPSKFFVQSFKTKEPSIRNYSTPSSCALYKNSWKKNQQAAKVNKRLSWNSRNPWFSNHVMDFDEISSGSIYLGADSIPDPNIYDLRMYEETASQNSNYFCYGRTIREGGSKRKNCSGKVSTSGCDIPWIPPIELPAPVMKLDERVSDENYLSTNFSNVKRRAATSCVEEARQSQNNYWAVIATRLI